MEKTDDFLRKRLIWKAKSYDLPTTSSFYYQDLSKEIQKYLNHFIDDSSTGLPVLFFTKPTKQWTLVCTRQVICNNNQSVFRIQISDIEKFNTPALKDPRERKARMTSELQKKSDWNELIVIDRQGDSYGFHADKGHDLFAMWNILLMAVRISG